MDKIEVSQVESAFKRLTQEGRRFVVLDLSEATTHNNTLAATSLVIWTESFRAAGGKLMIAGASRSMRNNFIEIDAANKLNLRTDVVFAIKSMSPRPVQS